MTDMQECAAVWCVKLSQKSQCLSMGLLKNLIWTPLKFYDYQSSQ